jgi:hypothetical protein
VAALESWLKAAHAARHNDLVHFNYQYETVDAPGAVPPLYLDYFETFLEIAERDNDPVGHQELLNEFVEKNYRVKLGDISVVPSTVVTSIFSAAKFSSIFGVKFLQMWPDDIAPADLTAAHQEVTRELKEFLQAMALRTGATATSGPTVRVGVTGRRSVTSTRANPALAARRFKKGEVVWVTTLKEAKAAFAKGAAPSERVLYLRRILGIPTCYWSPGPMTPKDEFLSKVFLSLRFRERPGVTAPTYRKPTVFSGGFADIFGTFLVAPPGDGWGRTITLCSGDSLDGSEGLREAVVSLADLSCSSVLELAFVRREDAPILSALVDVPKFLARRHSAQLGMDIS